MFKAITDTENSKILISTFQCFSIFVEFITIDINEKGIHMYSFDGSQVLFIEIILDKTFFSDFQLQKPVSFVLKVDLLDICLKSKKSIDSIVIKYNEDIFEMIFHRSGGYVSHFKIPEMIVQPCSEKVVVPDLKYESGIVNNIQFKILKASGFTYTKHIKILTELKPFGHYPLKIGLNETCLLFESTNSLVKSSITLYNNKTKDFYIIGKGVYEVEFKNSYLLKVDKVLKKLSVKECLLQFGQNLPLSLIFNIHHLCTFQFFLAPMI